MAAKTKIYDETEVVSESVVGPTDYRQIINKSKHHLKGLPLGDGTSISVAPGPYSSDGSHISAPVLNKYIGKYLRRLAKEGVIAIEPVKGV